MPKQKRNTQSKKKGKWRNRIINLLLVLLLIVGVLLIFSNDIKNYFIQNMVDKNSIANISPETIKKNTEKPANFDFDAVQSIDLESVLKAKLNPEELYQLGAIAIPSVKINLPIYKGTSNYAISFGAGTLKDQQTMGAGNYSLASHDMLDKSLLFSPLHNLELGATIYLTDLEYVYVYKADVKEVVEPTRGEVIDDVPDKTLVTLVTCADGGATRLIVQGTLEKKVSVKDADKEMATAFDADLNGIPQ